MTSDLELLERWRAGDPSAGTILFDRHFRTVYRFFAHKAREAVDDLVQQTFLACVESRDRFRADASFRAFVLGIARNILLRYYTKQHKERERINTATASVHDLASPSPSSVVAQKDEERVLLEGLRRIPLNYQIALELYHFEGMRGRELAEVLNIPEPTVRSRLRRGAIRLREQFEQLEQADHALQSTVTDLASWAESLRQLALGDDNDDDDDDDDDNDNDNDDT
ncbi:MAG: sigma-70 family RNA polymerase sigma factor [Nannocystaceae bacterium]